MKCEVRLVLGFRLYTDVTLLPSWSKSITLEADAIVSGKDPSCQWAVITHKSLTGWRDHL